MHIFIYVYICMQQDPATGNQTNLHQPVALFFFSKPKIAEERDQVRRFITLIDALYESHAKVVCTAALDPISLCLSSKCVVWVWGGFTSTSDGYGYEKNKESQGESWDGMGPAIALIYLPRSEIKIGPWRVIWSFMYQQQALLTNGTDAGSKGG